MEMSAPSMEMEGALWWCATLDFGEITAKSRKCPRYFSLTLGVEHSSAHNQALGVCVVVDDCVVEVRTVLM